VPSITLCGLVLIIKVYSLLWKIRIWRSIYLCIEFI